MIGSNKVSISDLSVADLSQVLAKMSSARALAMAACTCRLWMSAADLAYREMCISTGRTVQWDQMPCLNARQQALPAHAHALPGIAESMTSSTPSDPSSSNWRQVYFEQSYALSFNGMNDYMALPSGLLRQLSRIHGIDLNYSIDTMFLAHAKDREHSKECVGILPGIAGGMLFGVQDREFGRSRRAARLFSLAVLYVGTDGRLHSAAGVHSDHIVADDQWHRATLTVTKNEQDGAAHATLYLDGEHIGVSPALTEEWASIHSLPSYAVLGSGITAGQPYGKNLPVYNCHTFHGLIDELRIWGRALHSYEVKELAWQRIASRRDMPYAHRMIGSWSFTEGTGNAAHEHLSQVTAGVLSAVTIPSAHHTYGFVSNLVQNLPCEAVESKGPVWVNSTAPVEGQLVMDFVS